MALESIKARIGALKNVILQRELGALFAALRPLTASKTYDPGNLADGAGETTTITVTGAALGDRSSVSFSLDTQGLTITSWVSAADTVSVLVQNISGGSLNIAEGTLYAWVYPRLNGLVA